MKTSEARVQYIHSLMNEPSKNIVKEFRQLLLDVLDIVEQTDEEKYVMGALDGFESVVTEEKWLASWQKE